MIIGNDNTIRYATEDELFKMWHEDESIQKAGITFNVFLQHMISQGVTILTAEEMESRFQF